MTQTAKRFVEWAEENGWIVRLRPDPVASLPAALIRRYPHIPKDYVAFACEVETAATVDDTAFILCFGDFERQTGVRWNEFELLSLDAANTDADEKWKGRIRNFWDKHLPVLISVKGEYSCYAIRMTDWRVVRGYAPEFEEATIVARSFDDLLDAIMQGRVAVA